MIRTQINLTEEQYRNLQLEAKRKAQSLSAVVREKIDKAIAKKKKGNAWVLLEMAKKAGHGPADLAENYKEYLYGKKSLKWGKLK